MVEDLCNLIGVPCSVYIDDYCLFCVQGLEPLMYEIVETVLGWFGLAISTKLGGTILGRIDVATDLLGLNYKSVTINCKFKGTYDAILIEAPHDKLLALQGELQNIRGRLLLVKADSKWSWRCPTIKEIQRIAGLLVFINWNSKTRQSVPQLSVLWRATSMSDEDFVIALTARTYLEEMIEAFTALESNVMGLRSCHTLSEREVFRETCTFYTDAMLNRDYVKKGTFYAGVGGICIFPGGHCLAYSYIYETIEDVPEWARNWIIIDWEAMAVAVLLDKWGFEIKSRRSNCLGALDNIGATWCFYKQWSGRGITRAIVLAVINYLYKMNIFVYWTWISSKRNPCDALSRLIHVTAKDLNLEQHHFRGDDPLAYPSDSPLLADIVRRLPLTKESVPTKPCSAVVSEKGKVVTKTTDKREATEQVQQPKSQKRRRQILSS